jgi:hypothetical protein
MKKPNPTRSTQLEVLPIPTFSSGLISKKLDKKPLKSARVSFINQQKSIGEIRNHW